MAAVEDQRRNFKERKDCLQMYSNSELTERLRLDYDGIMFDDSLVRDWVSNGTKESWIIFGALTFDYITIFGHRKNAAVQRGWHWGVPANGLSCHFGNTG